MRNKQKNVAVSKNTRVVHVETDLAVVNIFIGLTNAEGERVERIEVLPNKYAGEPEVVSPDTDTLSFRIVESTAGTKGKSQGG